MRALVLERQGELALRDLDIREALGTGDVRVAIQTVGICGSDVHYYLHGRIGDHVVNQPMVLGHEAAGIVVEVGDEVTQLRPGDRVCMEPGVTDPNHDLSRQGLYNLDPGVRFWATPPIHGVLRPSVVHPASLCYRLPDNVSFAEGAMVEPLAVGVHAVNKAQVRLGDTVAVLGAGTIGVLTGLVARAAGASRVIMTEVNAQKLGVLEHYPFVVAVDPAAEDITDVVAAHTNGRGADVVFEASGAVAAAESSLDLVRAGGAVVFVGMPQRPIAYDVVKAQRREVRVEHVFRYANVFARTVELLAGGQVDVAPLLSRTFSFEDAVTAFELAASGAGDVVKVQIDLGEPHAAERA